MTPAPGEEQVEAIKRQHEPYQWDKKGNGICRTGGRHCYVCVLLTRLREVEGERDTLKAHLGFCEGQLKMEEYLHDRDSALLKQAEQRVELAERQLSKVDEALPVWKGMDCGRIEMIQRILSRAEQAEQRVAGLEAVLKRIAESDGTLIERDIARAALTPSPPAP